MDLTKALKEVDREDGFWAHLVAKQDNMYSWKRYQEIPGGGWSEVVLDEGEFNAWEANNYSPPYLPWVVWIQTRSAGVYPFSMTGGGGGPDSFDAKIVAQQGRVSSWKRVKFVVSGADWEELEEGGTDNAYEANGRVLEQVPWHVRLCPRSIEGEYMFSA